jgi:hypothetical protein
MTFSLIHEIKNGLGISDRQKKRFMLKWIAEKTFYVSESHKKGFMLKWTPKKHFLLKWVLGDHFKFGQNELVRPASELGK